MVASFAGSTDYTSADSNPITFTISQAAPTVAVTDAGGGYSGSAFTAAATVAGVVAGVDDSPASSLEGVAPTLTYCDATGTQLAGAPTLPGIYTVVASFAGSTDYTSAVSDPATFTIDPPAIVFTVSNNNDADPSDDPVVVTGYVTSLGGFQSANALQVTLDGGMNGVVSPDSYSVATSLSADGTTLSFTITVHKGALLPDQYAFGLTATDLLGDTAYADAVFSA